MVRRPPTVAVINPAGTILFFSRVFVVWFLFPIGVFAASIAAMSPLPENTAFLYTFFVSGTTPITVY